VAIARKYLIPKSIGRSGLQRKDVKYSKAALLSIAEGYAREAGLRNFEKALDKIHRKLARKSVLDTLKLPITIEPAQIEEYLGKPIFYEEGIKKITRPGMTLGLAWTPLGGAMLTIEAVANPGKEGLRLTGQLGNVMQESANIAYTYVRHIAGDFGVDKEFFEKNQIHLHVPAGATPKDGPSAGITITAALYSAVSGRVPKKGCAMTGEITLTDRLLAVGGVKEKILAAHRNGMTEVLMPELNRKDIDELPREVISSVDFVFADTMTNALLTLFPRTAGGEKQPEMNPGKTKPASAEKGSTGKKSA